jgi:uncharacterized phage protein gp47/JayE
MGEYVTPSGFTPKRADQIKTEIEEAYKSIYGVDVNLEPASTNGQEIGVYTDSLADVWDLVSLLANQNDMGAVQYRFQELLYQLIGITRNQATHSKVDLEITGTEGTIVSATFQARNENDLTFQIISYTAAERTIGVSGVITLSAESLVTGPYSADADTITVIVANQAGISAVTNPQAAVPGRPKESNPLFRLRASQSTAAPGQNTLESLFSQLADIEEVTAVRIYQNKEDAPDPALGNLAGHSFLPVVQGGDEELIAEIVWRNSPEGIRSYGDTDVVIQDLNGNQITIAFQRPVETNIYVDILTTKFSNYPGDGDSQIRQNILDFVIGSLYAETGGFTGFGIGQNILFSRLYQPINLVQGHNITEVKISDQNFASAAESDIIIPYDAIGVFASNRIKINGQV